MPTIPNNKKGLESIVKRKQVLDGEVATSLKVVAEHHFVLQDLGLLLHLDSTEKRILYVKIR